jgi:transcriptional antiterminator RfaH
VDGSLTANHFAHTELALAGSTLLEPAGQDSFGQDSLGQGSARQGSSNESRSPGGRRLTGSRPDLYPSDLLSSGPCLENGSDGVIHGKGPADESTQASWWLAHTLPRQEKAVAAALYSRDVAYYLPLVTRKSLSRGRTRVAQITLFPGYIFIRGNEEDRLSVLKTNRVLTVRQAPDGDRLRADLRRFFDLIHAGAPLLPEARLIAGERVRVKAGPFRDQEGVVIRRNGKTRLLIAIDYLQQGASLEVDDCLLERV